MHGEGDCGSGIWTIIPLPAQPQNQEVGSGRRYRCRHIIRKGIEPRAIGIGRRYCTVRFAVDVAKHCVLFQLGPVAVKFTILQLNLQFYSFVKAFSGFTVKSRSLLLRHTHDTGAQQNNGRSKWCRGVGLLSRSRRIASFAID